MIVNKDILELLTESYRAVWNTNLDNMDKFCEIICAFVYEIQTSYKNIFYP